MSVYRCCRCGHREGAHHTISGRCGHHLGDDATNSPRCECAGMVHDLQRNMDDFFECGFCGCRTNARIRACCEAGRSTDVELARMPGSRPMPGRPVHHVNDADRYMVEMIRMANSKPASPALAPQRRSIEQLRAELAPAKAPGEMDWNDLEDVATEILEHYDELSWRMSKP